jgi:hypothetical protein
MEHHNELYLFPAEILLPGQRNLEICQEPNWRKFSCWSNILWKSSAGVLAVRSRVRLCVVQGHSSLRIRFPTLGRGTCFSLSQLWLLGGFSSPTRGQCRAPSTLHWVSIGLFWPYGCTEGFSGWKHLITGTKHRTSDMPTLTVTEVLGQGKLPLGVNTRKSICGGSEWQVGLPRRVFLSSFPFLLSYLSLLPMLLLLSHFWMTLDTRH